MNIFVSFFVFRLRIFPFFQQWRNNKHSKGLLIVLFDDDDCSHVTNFTHSFLSVWQMQKCDVASNKRKWNQLHRTRKSYKRFDKVIVLVSSNFLWWFYIRRIRFSPSFALTQSKNMNTHVYRFQPTTYICLITVASDEFLSDVFTFGLFFYDISIIAQA